MQVGVDAAAAQEARVELLALLLMETQDGEPRLPSRAAAIDQALGGAIQEVFRTGDFRGKRGQTLTLYPGGAIPASRLLLVGLGQDSELDDDALRAAAGSVVGRAGRAQSAALLPPAQRRARTPAAWQAMAEGAVLARYRFDTYRKREEEEEEQQQGGLESLALSIDRPADLRAARAAVKTGVILAESQNLARELSNLPPNALTPAELARAAQEMSKEVGLKVRVLGPAELERRKMAAILAVGGGSEHRPRLVVMEHNAPKGRSRSGRRLPTVCFVGKGITFDSGGISIKPAPAMDEMKHDMSGAAAVIGAMRACALLRVPVHVIGIVGAAENMPSGSAYRPGDIVTSMSGKTIEVLNTDAEGRVVLADALHYAIEEFAPEAIVDLATLTGACVVALGSQATGLFGNHDRLIERVRKAGEATAERAWPMPLWAEHRKAVKSEVATVKNVAGREAAASTAAAFLAAFVGDTPWVHLDIAGTGWTGKPSPYQPRGATGVGVRLLLELLKDWKKAKLD